MKYIIYINIKVNIYYYIFTLENKYLILMIKIYSKLLMKINIINIILIININICKY